MAGMEEAFGQILKNPEAMQQIFSLAQSLGLGQSQGQAPPMPGPSAAPPPALTPQPTAGGQEMDALFRTILDFASKAGGDERQIALFEALKPFLKPEQARQIDKAIQVARISRMAGAALQRFGLGPGLGGGKHV